MWSYEDAGRELDEYLHRLTDFLDTICDRLEALEAQVGTAAELETSDWEHDADEGVAVAASRGADPRSGSGGRGADPRSGSGGRGADPRSGSGGRGADPRSGSGGRGADPRSGSGGRGADPRSGSGGRGADPRSGSGGRGADPRSGSGGRGRPGWAEHRNGHGPSILDRLAALEERLG